MQMINALFLKIVEMSLTAGIVIGVVMFVRLLIGRLPKGFAYVLWIVAAFRLAVPFSAGSDISIFNLFAEEGIGSEYDGIRGREPIGMKSDAGHSGAAVRAQGESAGQDYVQSSEPNAGAGTESTSNTEADVNLNSAAVRNDSFISMMAIVWIFGICILVLYAVIASIRIRRRIRYSIRLYGNVYACDKIRSPFVLGIVSPRIYMPFRLSEAEQQCILAHERYHILRRDYLIKNAAYMLAVVYWFQPMVWVAYHFMCIDMEMSCDEKIISGFTSDMRKEYSRLLLAFATNKRQFPVSPLAFGEENTMKRVRNILNYQKAARWKLAGGAAVVMITMAACATDANTKEAMSSEPEQAAIGIRQDTNAGVHYSERHSESGHHPAEPMHHTIEHHPAQWAENSMFDMEFYSLDYADSDKIVFHISSGLFEYDLEEEKITRSIDLKVLDCQAVQTGGECKVTVYQNSDNRLRAVIKPYPYSDEKSYVYDLEDDKLFAYDALLLDNYVMFDGFASKYDPAVAETMRTWRAAGNVLPLAENSYGALYWGPGPDLANMSYEAGDRTWQIFHPEQATLPRLSKQDDSFYQSFSLYSGKNASQCMIDYRAFYNRHDYDGVCALSTGLEYSEELRQEFSEQTGTLSNGHEKSCSEDGTEYLIQYSYCDESGENEQEVYVKFRYLENEGWRAEGLPVPSSVWENSD